jgi:RNA polymerase sigma factor (TIGR02999 family)
VTERTAGPDAPPALRGASRESFDQLVALAYNELRVIAHRNLARRGRPHGSATLNTTALVNEAYLRLVNQHEVRADDRAHFLAIAAVAMRHILIDRAKSRAAKKRGGGEAAVTFDDTALAVEGAPETLLEINEALDRVAEIDPRLARVVECRFFGGLSEEEIAQALGVTVRTVQRDWAKARMLLRRELAR